MGVLSSQWDKLLIHNWKGNPEFIKYLKRPEGVDESTTNRTQISARTSSANQRGSNALNDEQFVSFHEYNARMKFFRSKRVSIMKQRLQTKDLQSKNFEIIPSIMPHALEINPGIKLKNEL